jgi:hypothetical protein
MSQSQRPRVGGSISLKVYLERKTNSRFGSPNTAMTYKTAIDDPSRITKSKAAGALFGLTPKKYQSGEKDITGGSGRHSMKQPMFC